MYFCLLPKCHWASSFIWHKNKDSLIISACMTLNYPRVSHKCKDSYIVWHRFDQNCSLKFCNTQVIIVSHMAGGIWLIRGFNVKQKSYNQSLRELKKLGLKKQLVFRLQPHSLGFSFIIMDMKRSHFNKCQLSILKKKSNNSCKIGNAEVQRSVLEMDHLGVCLLVICKALL